MTEKLGVSKIFFVKEITTFIQQGCIKLIKSNSTEMYCYSFFLFQINAVCSVFIKIVCRFSM